MKVLMALGLLAGLPACASGTKPCSQAGDVSWVPPLKRTDRRCAQRRLPDGKYVNQGRYEEFNEAGELVLEGQFENGKKTGLWTQYDGKNHRIAERRFENGIDVGIMPGASSSGPASAPPIQVPARPESRRR